MVPGEIPYYPPHRPLLPSHTQGPLSSIFRHAIHMVEGGPGRGAVGRGIPIYPQVPSLPSCYGGYPLGGGPRYGWYYRVLYMYMLTGINSSWNIIILSMVVDFYIYMYMVFPV